MEQGQTTNSLACLLLRRRGELVPYTEWKGKEGGQWGGLGVLPRTLLLLLIPCFSPGSSKVVVGFFNPVYFFGSRICPQLHVHVVIFSLTVSLYLGAKERCV